MRRYLTFGGFLLIDSADGTVDGAFDQSVRKLIDAVNSVNVTCPCRTFRAPASSRRHLASTGAAA